MPTRLKRERSRPPEAWQTVLYYANGRPTAETWKRFLYEAPPAPMALQAGARLPEGPAEGVTSLQELEQTLGEFRELLSRLVAFPTIRQAEASDFRTHLNARAQGVFKGWLWVRGTGRLFPRIEPAGLTLGQSLYAQLVTAMAVERFTVIKQCRRAGCGRFFYDPRRTRVHFCSSRCRRLETTLRVQQYREKHLDEYREYQRRLMAKRRREGKA